MIKEKKKNTKYNYTKTKAQIITEYLRTAICSVLLAFFITTGIAIHARNEMIKDIFANASKQDLIDKKIAIEIITQTDIVKDLKNKKYSVCMHAGKLYESAGDYPNAQKAYELAISKLKSKSYKPYYHLTCVLTAQEKFDLANALLENLHDIPDKSLIKLKTRGYLVIGDKYYSIGKFLSAAKSYEKAEFYYNKFSKKDNVIVQTIKNRIVHSYIQVADIMVRSGLNSEAVRFLKKAEQYAPNDFTLRYKLAIVLSDLDPEKSVTYFETLLKERPQDIDYGIYNTALMKAANIADLDNRPTKAKYYRYKIRSIDMFVNRKVVYKNDINIELKPMPIRKKIFTYPLKTTYYFYNMSNIDIVNLQADFILYTNDKPVETVSTVIADKNTPLLSNTLKGIEIPIEFKKKVYTKRDVKTYKVKIFLYKDEKYKTYVGENEF